MGSVPSVAGLVECAAGEGFQGGSSAIGVLGVRQCAVQLMAALAQGRPEPIPFYAEMSSINPVLLFPAGLAARGRRL